jgi:hypothetical protein
MAEQFDLEARVNGRSTDELSPSEWASFKARMEAPVLRAPLPTDLVKPDGISPAQWCIDRLPDWYCDLLIGWGTSDYTQRLRPDGYEVPKPVRHVLPVPVWEKAP